MNRKILIPAGSIAGIAVLLGALIAFGVFPRATAQEGVIRYLEERFKELNIPVTEITILSESPLHLKVVVQSASGSVAWEDRMILHTVDREVFISARQRGYVVDRLAKILLDNQGKQIYYVDDGFVVEQMNSYAIPFDASPSTLSDAATEQLVNDLLIKYNFYGNFVTTVSVTSLDGFQTLDIQAIVPSLEEANRIAEWAYGIDGFAIEANSQGAQIVVCTFEIEDETGHVFLESMFDLQLQSGSWSQDKNLIDFSEGPMPDLLDSPTPTPLPIETATATPTP